MEQRTCTIDGCERAHRARGLCGSHYNQTYQLNRHKKAMTPCYVCGEMVEKHPSSTRRPVCSSACRNILRHGYGCEPPPREPSQVDLRSAIRRAYEDGDRVGLIDAIRSDCATNPDGCWVWSRSTKNGYAIVPIGTRQCQVHRLSLEAKMGGKLGTQQAHHVCANTRCVNPDHLEPVTHAENVGEMMARQSYVARIRELEDALHSFAPNHELLARLPVA